MADDAGRTFTGVDGKEYWERRTEEWYSNKDLHEKIVSVDLKVDTVDRKVDKLTTSIEKYNGLQESRKNHEGRIKSLEDCLIAKRGTEKFFDAAFKYIGWAIAILAFYFNYVRS